MEVDVRKVKHAYVTNVDMKDYPDFCDAYLEYGEIDDRELTDEEIDWINENEGEWVHELAHESLH